MSTIFIISLILLIPIVWLLIRCHQAQRVNWGATWMNYLDGLNRLFCQYYHRLPPDNFIDLPEKGGAIIVANHLSGVDGFLLIASSLRPVRFLIAREYYDRFWAKWLLKRMGCIPVERSTNPEKALRAAYHALKSGEVIAIFPQATFVLPHDPPKKLKKGAFWLAQNTQSPIYPVYLSGITGSGHIIRAILLRGNTRVKLHPAISHIDKNTIEKVQILLDGNHQ